MMPEMMRSSSLHAVLAACLVASACARPAPRAPLVLPDTATPGVAAAIAPASSDASCELGDCDVPRLAVTPEGRRILSIDQVLGHVEGDPIALDDDAGRRSAEPAPRLALAAPLYGAASGAAMAIVLDLGYSLLTEHRFPRGVRDRARLDRMILVGAGVGLAGGSLALANSVRERAAWRARSPRARQPRAR